MSQHHEHSGRSQTVVRDLNELRRCLDERTKQQTSSSTKTSVGPGIVDPGGEVGELTVLAAENGSPEG
jgi:hypothetical protein